MNDDPLVARRLQDLDDHYTEEVNMLVAEGRDDLIADLSDQYLQEVAELLAVG